MLHGAIEKESVIHLYYMIFALTLNADVNNELPSHQNNVNWKLMDLKKKT